MLRHGKSLTEPASADGGGSIGTMHYPFHSPLKKERLKLCICRTTEYQTTKNILGYRCVRSCETHIHQTPQTSNDPAGVRAWTGKDSNCRHTCSTVRTTGSKMKYDRYGFYVRTSPINGPLLKVVLTFPQPTLSYHSSLFNISSTTKGNMYVRLDVMGILLATYCKWPLQDSEILSGVRPK